jgi:hypothetical protein
MFDYNRYYEITNFIKQNAHKIPKQKNDRNSRLPTTMIHQFRAHNIWTIEDFIRWTLNDSRIVRINKKSYYWMRLWLIDEGYDVSALPIKIENCYVYYEEKEDV